MGRLRGGALNRDRHSLQTDLDVTIWQQISSNWYHLKMFFFWRSSCVLPQIEAQSIGWFSTLAR